MKTNSSANEQATPAFTKIKFFSAGQYVKLSLHLRRVAAPIIGADDARKHVIKLVRSMRADAAWKAQA